MQNKLQELTDKLYSEGLSKGKKEAEELKAKAKKEADQIIAKANQEYKEILEKAKKDAQNFRLKTENEIKMVARQSLATVKQNIENIIVTNATAAPIKEEMESKQFLGEIIREAIKAFNPEKNDAITLEVLLPESKKVELDNFIKNNILDQFNKGVEIGFDKKIRSGFKIGAKGKGYHIIFSDEEFQSLVSHYLKPVTRQFLFNE
jgi:V/A-type H+-transporting ATPase subunit E